ncbi:MAG: hypothetical protein IT324_05895 [Anaerolineae bacterium]|nr:hypothetical protein [Anaerolineae bacterium]
MPFLSRWIDSPIRFALLLTIGVGLFLLAVGFGMDTLPYPPAQGFPADGPVMPAGWPFSDAVISHWPNALYLQRAVRAGTWPLWRPLLMSGQPFAANPLNKVWYPPQWLVIILPVTLHLNLMIWGHLVLGGVGMYVLSRRLNLRSETAAMTGIAYAFTPRLLAATGAGHLDVVYAMAWFPWVLWAIHRAITDDGPILRCGAILGLIAALCFLADVRLSLFAFAIGAGLAVWLVLPHPLPPSPQAERGNRDTSPTGNPVLKPLPHKEGGAWGGGKALILGAALAVGLTAVQWLPLLELMPYLSRSGLTINDAGVFSLQPLQLITLVFADRGGSHETLIYIGIPILVLAITGFVRTPRRRIFWGLAALLAALYAMGINGPLWPVLVRIAPPLLWFRVPSRAWIVAIVALIILAGYGLETLTERRKRPTLRLAGAALIALGLLAALMAMSFPLRQGAGIAAVIGLIATGVVLLIAPRLPALRLTALVGVLILLDLIWVDVSLVRGLSQHYWLDPYEPIAQALLEAHVTRLYSPDYSFPQQAHAYWNIPDFGGVDPFQLKDYIPEFEAATGTKVSGYTVTLPPFNNSDLRIANRDAIINAEMLAQWNVSHVLVSFPLDVDGLSLVRRVDNLYLYENTFPLRSDSLNRSPIIDQTGQGSSVIFAVLLLAFCFAALRVRYDHKA